jgi:hypothetical protein
VAGAVPESWMRGGHHIYLVTPPHNMDSQPNIPVVDQHESLIVERADEFMVGSWGEQIRYIRTAPAG